VNFQNTAQLFCWQQNIRSRRKSQILCSQLKAKQLKPTTDPG
jgi:hypothetical protein